MNRDLLVRKAAVLLGCGAFVFLWSLTALAGSPVQSRPHLSDRRSDEHLGTRSLRFQSTGYTVYGDWFVSAYLTPSVWEPGVDIRVGADLTLLETHINALRTAKTKIDSFCMLVTAERTFDPAGHLRLPSDEKMSTLLTPTGLPIEGGWQGPITDRFGYGFKTPIDVFLLHPATGGVVQSGQRTISFSADVTAPADLPPGIYRIRLDFAIKSGTKYYSLNGDAFGTRPFFTGRPTESHVYSPPFESDGFDVSHQWIDASQIVPRIPWVLLAKYNSNGYKGVIAEEDKPTFGLASRNLIQDDVILPLYNDAGNKIPYSLEPQFSPDTIELRSNIPWNYQSGEMSVEVTSPDGKTTRLGTAPFVGASGQWPTTKRAAFTSWKPTSYGLYTLKVTGWLADIWGNRYEGGGTYRFWIAKRMTLATATFQGMPYPVGSIYGRDTAFAPAVPADVEVTATLFPYSDASSPRSVSFTGTASQAGVFGAAQGNKSLPLDTPGEYLGYVLARYTDPGGHLWVCSMRHAGVVYPADSPIVARGKKLKINGQLTDRGDTHFEGYYDNASQETKLAHVNFPYNPGDVLLIASEGLGANKIEPVITWESKLNPAPYDPAISRVGGSNVRIKTSNGYSPHLFPEYITELAYYYGSAARPGFMGRFLVGEDGVRSPYWPTSPNSFGGQINASSNGDLPGDIYRFMGGVVIRKTGQTPEYAGYLSSGFMLAGGSHNNRVIAPGTETLLGSDGSRARFFLVGLRPGMMYATGHTLAFAVQIDPILPVNVTWEFFYPDGKQVVTTGKGDAFGSAVGKDRFVLDQPGVYRYKIQGEWDGNSGYMPGLPKEGGFLYVVEKDRPADAPVLSLNFPAEYVFPAKEGFVVKGNSTAQQVYYAAVIPGAVIGQGWLPVTDGTFIYYHNPNAVTLSTPTYDTVNRVKGTSELGDVVHLTFFSRETTADGRAFHSLVRLIVRGTRVIHVK
ncbi:MAG: hypothetical protein EHM61_19695 [Acidobacteria bacterium]|nr:MAG: hypothetical protein EHM61_19695 [Acidobacteriota bacterium]